MNAWAARTVAIDQPSINGAGRNAEQGADTVKHHHLFARNVEVNRNVIDESGDATFDQV